MIWQDIEQIRQQKPLVLNITNYVVMNTTANALLALGASPVMAHAIEEVEELVALCQALVLNIGTLSTPWIEAMLKAGKEANRRNIPIVLDPVGCGATQFRTTTAKRLIEALSPTVIRGNASEIGALVQSVMGARGVDSRHSPEEVKEEARLLANQTGGVVSISGQVDLVVDSSSAIYIENGHPLMTQVTGMGCTSTAITGAFLAVNKSPLEAASHAMAVMGVAGEISAERVLGPGSFQVQFLDQLYGLSATDIGRRLKIKR